MAVHLIIDIRVNDKEKFKVYAQEVQTTVKNYGGKTKSCGLAWRLFFDRAENACEAEMDPGTAVLVPFNGGWAEYDEFGVDVKVL